MALSGVIVRAVGPAPFFPVSGGVLVVVILFALSERQFRLFGTVRLPAVVRNQAT